MKIKPIFLRFVTLSLGLFPWLAAAQAGALSFKEARQSMHQNMPMFQAAQAAEDAAYWQQQAFSHLGMPFVILTAQASRYQLYQTFDTAPLMQQIVPPHSAMPPQLSANPLLPLLPALEQLVPPEMVLDRKQNHSGLGVVAAWPIFHGGRIQAIHRFFDGRLGEASAERQNSQLKLDLLLVERYFSYQLAQYALHLHQDAVKTIGQIDHSAQRFFEKGMIAKSDRLEAAAKLASAKIDLQKAQSDANLAATALASLIKSPDATQYSTTLFINSQPLKEQVYYQNLAAKNQPALAKVAAQKQQAQALENFAKGRFLPSVNLFGASQIKRNNPNWIVGVEASWSLLDPLDRRAMVRASTAGLYAAEKMQTGINDQVVLLIEKNYHAVNNARDAYLLNSENIALYQEVLQLKKSGFKHGTHTATDVMLAETELLKAKTQRAKVAYDYIDALANLAVACGDFSLFTEALEHADIRLIQR